MPRAPRLSIYDDVRAILDESLRVGGGSFTLATHGQAVHWRHRAYKFRKLYAETLPTISPYDRLIFPRIPPESSTVVIELRQQTGLFLPKETEWQLPETKPLDDLEEIALALARKLEGN